MSCALFSNLDLLARSAANRGSTARYKDIWPVISSKSRRTLGHEAVHTSGAHAEARNYPQCQTGLNLGDMFANRDVPRGAGRAPEHKSVGWMRRNSASES